MRNTDITAKEACPVCHNTGTRLFVENGITRSAPCNRPMYPVLPLEEASNQHRRAGESGPVELRGLGIHEQEEFETKSTVAPRWRVG